MLENKTISSEEVEIKYKWKVTDWLVLVLVIRLVLLIKFKHLKRVCCDWGYSYQPTWGPSHGSTHCNSLITDFCLYNSVLVTKDFPIRIHNNYVNGKVKMHPICMFVMLLMVCGCSQGNILEIFVWKFVSFCCPKFFTSLVYYLPWNKLHWAH